MEFIRKLKKWGCGNGLLIPPDIVTYLEMEPETELIIKVQKGKHGKYITIWRKDQHVSN